MKDNHRPDSGRHLMQTAYEKLDSLGFDQIPCGSCCEGKGTDNLIQTLALAKDKLDDDLLKGFLVVPWQRTEPDAEYTLYDNAHRLYVARQKLYPETL